MTRKSNWPELLADFLEEAKKDRKFSYGEHGCALFTADAISVMTGQDPAAFFRNAYKGKGGATRILKKFAKGGLEKAVDKITKDNGMEEIPVLLARRGDVVFIDTPLGSLIGIVNLDGKNAVSASNYSEERALEPWPLSGCRRAWRV